MKRTIAIIILLLVATVAFAADSDDPSESTEKEESHKDQDEFAKKITRNKTQIDRRPIHDSALCKDFIFQIGYANPFNFSGVASPNIILQMFL